MPPAARIGDATDHGGTLLPPIIEPPGLLTVLIGGRPPAVVGSVHECVPHVELGPANLVLPPKGMPRSVFVAGLPLACLGDDTVCEAKIVTGAFDVIVGGVL